MSGVYCDYAMVDVYLVVEASRFKLRQDKMMLTDEV